MSDKPRQILTAAHVERASEIVYLRAAIEIANARGARLTAYLLRRLLRRVRAVHEVENPDA